MPQGGPLSPLLANITLDPLDKELERRGHRFARYADDFLVLVKSAAAAERVMASLTRFVEGRLKLVVNRVKSKAAPLRQCAFLGFQVGAQGRAVWTAQAHARFKQRVREITRRNRGHRVQDVIDELRRYVIGWLNYFGPATPILNSSRSPNGYDEACGYATGSNGSGRVPGDGTCSPLVSREEFKLATRSRKGYWRMAGNSIVQRH